MNTMTGEEMRKSSLRKKQKKTSKSSDSPPASFSSLPYDVVLNCLARVSRTHYPILSLVSKSFRSLMASPDLEAARSRIRKDEKCLFVSLNLNNNPNPSWYILTSTPKKLIPVPSFPYPYPSYSAVVSIGSDIYIIGGTVVKGKRSKRVYLFDCKAYQWRRLPNMCVARKEAHADVISGKICVLRGCSRKYYDSEAWCEFYDPKAQTWEPGSVVKVVKAGGFIDLPDIPNFVRSSLSCAKGLYYQGLKFGTYWHFCVVEIIEKKEWCRISVDHGKLVFSDLSPTWDWTRVSGLEEMSSNYLISVTNSSGGGKRVTVWWKTLDFCRETKIWCAEIALERRTDGVIWGVVEWSQNVFTFPAHQSLPKIFFGQYAIVTYDN